MAYLMTIATDDTGFGLSLTLHCAHCEAQSESIALDPTIALQSEIDAYCALHDWANNLEDGGSDILCTPCARAIGAIADNGSDNGN